MKLRFKWLSALQTTSLQAGPLQASMQRFNALSVRERLFIGIGALAIVLVGWDSLLMQPLNTRQAALLAILNSSVTQTTATEAADTGEATEQPAPVSMNMLLTQRENLQQQLAMVEKNLQAVSADLVAPEHTSEVLYAVLQQQQHLSLISLRNQPLRSLLPAVASTSAAASDTTSPNAANPLTHNSPATALAALGPGPYLHPVELVVEGSYLDILAYLRALEALPWHFVWQRFQLDSSHYPLNRARIELSTLSLDTAWIG